MWTEMPQLNHAKSDHVSMVLANHLYVLGGCFAGSLPRVECFEINSHSAWVKIFLSQDLVKRWDPAIAVLSSN